MAAMQALLPAPTSETAAQHATLKHFTTWLTSQADMTQFIGNVYQAMTTEFYSLNPTMYPQSVAKIFKHDPHLRHVAEQARALMDEYEAHFYFPLGRLMQLLPGDIANVPRLTPEEGRMCEAVSGFANRAYWTLYDGLRAIDLLLPLVDTSQLPQALPDMNEFRQYLAAEAEFMQANKNDYASAANNIKRVAAPEGWAN